MSTITKQWLQQKIADMEATRDEIPFGLDEEDSNTLQAFKLALASLEVEPVAYIRAAHNPDGFCFADGIHPAHRHQKLPLSTLQDGCYWTVTPLYTAPPAPASDEDRVLAEQARAVIHCLDMCGVPLGDYADNEQLQLWGRVIEYGRLPAPVSVPDEIEPTVEAIKRVLPTSNPDEYAACIGADMWNACRAAMLQGGNYPVIPDGLRLALSNAGIAAPESDEMLAATCEKHIQALVTWVKERKPFQPAAPQQEVKNG